MLVAKTSCFGPKNILSHRKKAFSSTAALDGRGVFNFMNTFFKFLRTERAAKMSLFGGSLKYDSTIFATLVFRRFWLSKREPKKSSFGSSTNTSSPLLSWLLDCLSTALISLISSWLSFSTTATSSLLYSQLSQDRRK